MSLPESTPTFSWSRLGRGNSEAESTARAAAMELARALAAQTIALDRDAVVQELPDRIRAIGETLWPSSPLAGYGLHSSLGAYLVTKVAVGWAPGGHVGLRHEALDRAGLTAMLVEQGVDRASAQAVLGDFGRVERGFVPDTSGLDTSRIAGLVEGALSRAERQRALSQVAFSGRCLGRLSSAIRVYQALRAVLPVLPRPELGAELSVAMAAFALGRPERALEILGEHPANLAARTLSELALAVWHLGNGEAAELPPEPGLWLPKLASTSPPVPPPEDGDQDTDDVLEIVEERLDPGPELVAEAAPAALPRLAAGGAALVEDVDLAAWTAAMSGTRTPIARHGDLLGLRLPLPPRSAWPVALPPEPRALLGYLAARNEGHGAGAADATERIPVGMMLGEGGLTLSGGPEDALFPTVRSALRVVARAPEGEWPTDDAIRAAGDLGWVLLRARILAHVVRGELGQAAALARGAPAGAYPEALWAKDRLLRYGERTDHTPAPAEARGAASTLGVDLCLSLGRSLTGVPAGASRAVAGSEELA